MLEQGFSQIQIDRAVGKDKSMVSREKVRNCDKRSHKYRNCLDQKKYTSRIKDKAKHWV